MTDSIQKEIKGALEKINPFPWQVESAIYTFAPNAEWFKLWDKNGKSLITSGSLTGGYILGKDNAKLIFNAPTWLLHQQKVIERMKFNHKQEIDAMQVAYDANDKRQQELIEQLRTRLGEVEDESANAMLGLYKKLEQKDTEIEQIEERWKELLRVRMSVDNTKIWNLEDKLKQQAEEIRKLQEIIESQDNVWMRNMQLAKELEEKLEENKRLREALKSTTHELQEWVRSFTVQAHAEALEFVDKVIANSYSLQKSLSSIGGKK